MASSGFVGGGEDQDRLLDEATAVVKEQAFYMKRAIDNDNLREALKHASNLICELRTSLLSPKNYYELYMQVFQEMQHLSAFFSDKGRHGRKMLDLYESVQHAGNILPRMYLLATVGASYIKSKEAPAKEILKDMGELCKGVQHPMRGLFLRYYLSQMVKDKLPDTGTEFEAEGGGNIDDAFDFILSNFIESNRLWVRMQNQGPMKDKSKREKERHDLRVLVGANLVRLSQLEGMTVEYYAEIGLPKILEHILSVKDVMSQQYLFESMIQVFADEYQIRTLEQVLASYTKAQPGVDMKPIMVALMNRLANFLQNAEGPHALSGVDIFSLFRTHLQAILERTLEPGAAGGTVPPEIAPPLEVQSAFMDFTLTLYPDKMHYVDIILGSTVDVLTKYFQRVGEEGGKKKLSGPGAEKVVDLLASPQKTLSLQVLEMDHYKALFSYLHFDTRKKVASAMVSSVVDENRSLDNVDMVNRLFEFISPLIQDEDDTPGGNQVDAAFTIEQHHVCKLVHQVHIVDDPDLEFQILSLMRNYFGKGGTKRIGITLQPLIWSAMSLISKIRELNSRPEPLAFSVTIKKIFQFIHKSCTVLTEHAPVVALQLWLAAAVSADQVDRDDPGTYEPICFEFFTQALLCFEENIPETTNQFQGVFQLVGAFTSIIGLEPENVDTIQQNIIKQCSKLLKKPLQVRAIAACANTFWCQSAQNGKRVLECLQKCLKTTDSTVQSDYKLVGLWVEMLDQYIYFFENKCEEVTSKFILSLLNLCKEHIEFAEADSDAKSQAAAAKQHLANTHKYIKFMQRNGNDEEKARFAEIEVV